MAGVETNDRQLLPSKAKGQPVGELAGLKADPHSGRCASADGLAYGVRIGCAFTTPDDLAFLVDDVDRGGLKGDIKADIVLLVRGSTPGCGTRRLSGDLAWRSLRLRHVPTLGCCGEQVEPTPKRSRMQNRACAEA